ncbi:MAG: hypothetical protein FWC69_01715 [Defluviitaleaceae bacterium]|nr:hypothetical protein [Defluviitaleaceae bacterium]
MTNQINLAIALNGEYMGKDESIGKVFLSNFLNSLSGAATCPEYIILYNSAVKIACQNDFDIENLKMLEARGTKILLCGTCVKHYDIESQIKIGTISNIHEITQVMMNAKKLISG